MQSPAVDPPTRRTQFAARDHRPCFKNKARRSTRLVSAFVLLTLGFAAVNLAPVAVHAQASNDDFPDVDKIMPKARVSPSPNESRSEIKTPERSQNFDDRSTNGAFPQPNRRLDDPVFDDSRTRRPNREGTLPAVESRPRSDFKEQFPRFDQQNNRVTTPTPAERIDVGAGTITKRKGFDWSTHSTSVADLRLPKLDNRSRADVLQHDLALLTLEEEALYLDLLDDISLRRQALLKRSTEEFTNAAARTAAWEKAFYQFESVRRLAWNNGQLRHREGEDNIGGLPNPFSDPKESAAADDGQFSLLDDMNRFPEHYVGRPVLLHGLYRDAEPVRLGADQPKRATAGMPGDDGRRPIVTVMRGALTTLNGNQQIATVDTQGLLTATDGLLGQNQFPRGTTIPVLVKGWMIKRWGQQPLIYCEALRQVSPIPHQPLIVQNTADRRRLRDHETWLYYETLRQLEMTSDRLQKEVALSHLQKRIGSLMKEIDTKTKADIAATTAKLKAGKITESEHRQRKSALQRRLTHRVGRYRDLLKHPEKFQTYVDMFQFPEEYHGRLVTLRGHVRHVVSYPGDETLFHDSLYDGGRALHELWLFTDDSQHNPAVIVTPNLPDDFPVDAEVIDRVSVTGCFFKRYVYGSQDTDRIAPLVLAGNIEWQPTADQVAALVDDGHLNADSSRAKKAAELNRGLSRTGTLMIGFFILLVLMILWGRAQREERDRVQLRKRVNEIPEFETSLVPGYSLQLTDFGKEFGDDESPAPGSRFSLD